MEKMILGLLATMGIGKEQFVETVTLVHNIATDLDTIKNQQAEILRLLKSGENQNERTEVGPVRKQNGIQKFGTDFGT